ncbi:MAG: DUF4410 domain-containing protein [candidate division Zixibacteria bacterium]|nr:DUF4410 domain-containing protein [candidate division Zixibacteria bacterium]
MKIFKYMSAVILAIAFLVSGCGQRYAITHNLEETFPGSSTCKIGYILDELPGNFPDDKKPSMEDIDKFKGYLKDALLKAELFDMKDESGNLYDYEVNGRLIDYKKGSGFLRFMFGAWAGKAKVTVALKIVEKVNNTEIFAGNFTGEVTSEFESGLEMFKRVAKDFAAALKKEFKRLNKGK